jgi:hypothetical protein|tara:strand:+ start:351 stop:563 length:213 start_codon:yes stop_codon:yes gene_type:complete
MLSNLQKRLKAKRHIKGLKSKKSLLLTQRMLASQRRDGYWLREVDSDLQIVNELLEEALSDFKNKRYRLP